MKFGVNTFIWSATFEPSHFELLPIIKQAGFDGWKARKADCQTQASPEGLGIDLEDDPSAVGAALPDLCHSERSREPVLSEVERGPAVRLPPSDFPMLPVRQTD